MTLTQVTQYVSMGIPLASFAALFAAVFFFVKMRGSVDALREAAATWQALAESKDAQVTALEQKIDELELKIAELTHALEIQKEAFRVAVDDFLARVGK